MSPPRGPAGLTLDFCEVKCRSGLGFGHPLEAITYAKMRTLRRLATVWMREHRIKASTIRLDAIGVVLQPRAGAIADSCAGGGLSGLGLRLSNPGLNLNGHPSSGSLVWEDLSSDDRSTLMELLVEEIVIKRHPSETDKDGRRHYLIRVIPYQDPQQEAERLKAVHEARVKIVPRV